MNRQYPKRRWFLFVVAFPWDILCWSLVVFIHVFWGKRLWWSEGSLWTELRPFSWLALTWYRCKLDYGKWRTWAGTVLGHGGFYGPGCSDGSSVTTGTEFHEHVHVEQHEVGMLRGFILGFFVFVTVGCFGQWVCGAIVGGVIWFSGYLHMTLPGWVVAWLRGKDAYEGSTHEEHARFSATKLLTEYLDDVERNRGR